MPSPTAFGTGYEPGLKAATASHPRPGTPGGTRVAPGLR